jgi:hypothetical protein
MKELMIASILCISLCLADKAGQDYVVPRTISETPSPLILEKRVMVPLGPPPGNQMKTIASVMNQYTPPPCFCAAQVRCQPCGVVEPVYRVDCPCAPRPNCPKCPPVSLIHEIASKKV